MAKVPAVTSAEGIAARAVALREQAKREWVALCKCAAAGEAVDRLSIQAVGEALGLRSSSVLDDFQADADALQRVAASLDDADRTAAAVVAELEPFNGSDDVLADAVRGAEARLEELKSVQSSIHWMRRDVHETRARARYLAAQHPRVFDGEAVR